MAVTRKSQHVMEITNAPSFVAGVALSLILIAGAVYYAANFFTAGTNALRLLVSMLLIWKGATFLLNGKMISMRFDKISGKLAYRELSIRGSKHLVFALRDITGVSVSTSKGWLPQDRIVEVCISVKEDAIIYNTTILSYPPKELAIGAFLGIEMDVGHGTLAGTSAYSTIEQALARQQAGSGHSADARKGKA